MRYTFRQLEVFVAVAQTQSITRAAKNLSMSQSAASSALRELETQFDTQLFDRVGKRLQLNELGRLFRPKVEALLSQGRELEQSLARHSDVGALNVGATLTIGNYIAVDIMAEYMKNRPESRVSLQVANTEKIVQRVRDFELDIGLIEGELQADDLDVIPWRADELVVFCHPEHTLAEKGRLTDLDLKAARWIVREPGSGTRQTFERGMHGLLPELTFALELEHTEAIKHAVEARLGIGCLSRVCLADAFRRDRFVELTAPSHRRFDRQFYFILHKQKYRSASIGYWMDLCQEMRHLEGN